MGEGLSAGIDLGTSGVRIVLIDRAGQTVAHHAVRIEAQHRRDPAVLWNAVAATLRAHDLTGVAALAVAGTSGTILPVDAQGTPRGPLSLYNAPAAPALVRQVAAHATPGSAALGPTSPLARALGFPTYTGLLHEADWITGRLLGRFGISDANNALKTGYDPVAAAWPDWIEHTGLTRQRLPQVVAPGAVLGLAAGPDARILGLPPAALIVAGTTDGCASFLATGAANTGDGVTVLGSTMTIKLLSDRPLFAPEWGVYSHFLLDRWLAGGASNTGGTALAQFFPPARITSLSAGIDPALDSGLDYYPLPAPGERFPIADPALPSRTTPRPADDSAFLHGLLEGIARIEQQAYARLAALGGPPVRRVITVGGGAANPVWTAIRRRILGVEVTAAATRQAANGAALLARRALVD
jgi:sugar (pentulose or hexulose) kinase